MTIFDKETIVACATPSGTSALAIIRLSGPLCQKIAVEAFNLKKIPFDRKAIFGKYRSLKNSILDEVIYTFFEQPASYTGDRMLEITTHGNALIIQSIVRDCLDRGCRLAEPGEFTRNAFLNGKIDLSQAEAISDLIHAKSQLGVEIARKQLAGSLSQQILTTNEDLVELIAQTEVYIDFAEEDIPKQNIEVSINRLNAIISTIKNLLKSNQLRNTIFSGFKIAIIGAPNAGKSSLLNGLLGEYRALTSPQAGTTRDFISEELRLGDLCIELVDTAGLRTAPEAIEKQGIEQTYIQIQKADFFLLVIDQSEAPPELDLLIFNYLTPKNTLIIQNKADLPIHSEQITYLNDYPRIKTILIQTPNLEPIENYLKSILIKDGLIDLTITINERHVIALQKALSLANEALLLIMYPDTLDLAVNLLRSTLIETASIIGSGDNEIILDKIFSSFCIGK